MDVKGTYTGESDRKVKPKLLSSASMASHYLCLQAERMIWMFSVSFLYK